MRKARPNTPVLFMTGHGDHALASKAVHAGAYDYIHKPIHRDLFVLSITRAIEAFQHRHNLPRSAGASFGALGQARRKPGLLHELTPRQREVLQLIAEGLSTKAMAQRLDLSVKTVETHQTELMNRLNIYDWPG